MDHHESKREMNGGAGSSEEHRRPDAAELHEIEELRQRIQALQVNADRHLRAVVRERPFLALGAALAAGFLLGRALRRI